MPEKLVRLDWSDFVKSVREGDFEPVGNGKLPRFMYCEKRNVIVSDQEMIRGIYQARSHEQPFMLIGEMGTGKNIFLELVAKGDALAQNGVECIDENIDGTFDSMMNKFFGKHGLVQNHPNALIHFDLLENAKDWPIFIDTLHELARSHIFYRTDGEILQRPDVRVVGGATINIDAYLKQGSASSFAYLLDFLTTNQFARTESINTRKKDMPILLAEILSSQILAKNSTIKDEDIEPLSQIREPDLKILQTYDWPGGYSELVRLVKDAIFHENWNSAIKKLIPDIQKYEVTKKRMKSAKKFDVFLCHNTADKPEVKKIARMLQEQGLQPWLDEWELAPGKPWQRMLQEQISQINAAAVFVGRSGIGPWQEREIDAFLLEFIRRDCPVIPVLLEGTTKKPKLPIFLKGMGWVDFRENDPNPMDQLIWGITGKRTEI